MLLQLNSLSLIGLFHKNWWNFSRVINFQREMRLFFLVGGSNFFGAKLKKIVPCFSQKPNEKESSKFLQSKTMTCIFLTLICFLKSKILLRPIFFRCWHFSFVCKRQICELFFLLSCLSSQKLLEVSNWQEFQGRKLSLLKTERT